MGCIGRDGKAALPEFRIFNRLCLTRVGWCVPLHMEQSVLYARASGKDWKAVYLGTSSYLGRIMTFSLLQWLWPDFSRTLWALGKAYSRAAEFHARAAY